MAILPADLHAGAVGGFTPRDRAIFRFGAGLAWRGDPLAIEERYEQALAEHNAEAIGQWLRHGTHNLTLLAFRKLVPVSQAALGVGPLDDASGVGLTGPEALAVIRRFFAYQRRITARYRRDAELVGTYGATPGPAGAPTYERYAGLWWNRERVLGLAAVAHYRALTAASGMTRMHFSLPDAMSPNIAAARLLDDRLESDRAEAEARSRSLRAGG